MGTTQGGSGGENDSEGLGQLFVLREKKVQKWHQRGLTPISSKVGKRGVLRLIALTGGGKGYGFGVRSPCQGGPTVEKLKVPSENLENVDQSGE